eukprot:11988.XXX_489573_489722_1 [CDS] Oithona nana genome sequencing.
MRSTDFCNINDPSHDHTEKYHGATRITSKLIVNLKTLRYTQACLLPIDK